MADDPDVLQMFRRGVDPRRGIMFRPAPPPRPGERLPYVAFDAKDKSHRLYVRGRAVCHRIPWGHMPLVTHGPWNYTQLIVTTADLVIIMRGQRLDPIAEAISTMMCDLVQEYDPRYFLEPTDPNAPLVERIESKLRHGMVLDAERPAASDGASKSTR